MPLDAASPELSLPDDLAVCHAMIRELLAALDGQTRELEGVRHRLEQLLRRLYGPKSEKVRPDQPSLFGPLPPPEPEPTPTPEPEPERAATKKRRGHGRRPLPADLPRVRREHDLSDADKACPCCHQPRRKIGEEISEQLDYRPASLFVWQHVRFTYACPRCLEQAPSATAVVATTPPPPAPVELPATPAATPTPPPLVNPEVPAPAPAATPAAAPDALATEPARIVTAPSDTPAPPTRPAAAATAAATPVPAPTVAVPSATSGLIVTAAKPAQPIDKGLPGPGLLAHIITSKYADHLPLHRQQGILARQGIVLSRSTLGDWMAAVALLLTPLYQLMLGRVKQSRVLQTDETRLPVLDGGDKTKSGRLWVYVGDRNHPYLIYDYRPDKSRAGPEAVLEGYQGFLQADAANVFDAFFLPGSIIEVGCWAHARRNFFDAATSDAARSAEALARIKLLYEVEHEAEKEIDEGGFVGEAADAVRRRWRQTQTLPRLTSLQAWLQAQQPVVLPKSPMGLAVAYALRHWSALTRFCEHGFLQIDNNAAERALRIVAVGRKNYLFAGSDRGGQTAAVLYTLTGTCRHLGLDPFVYLRDVLTQLPGLAAARLEELLPDRWASSQHQTLDR